MIRAVVALLVSLSLVGCFPHNKTARTYAQLGEGAALLAGIAVSAFAGTGADCDEMAMPGEDTSGCKTTATVLSTIGVTLIVGGLLGFVATVSTAEEAAKPAPMHQATTPTEATPTSAQPKSKSTGSAETKPEPEAGSGPRT